MSTDNFCQIIGNVTRDPELRFTTGGVAVVSLGIAWTPRKRNANGDWEDGETSFFNVTAWRDIAENVAASVTKGMRLVVIGSVKARNWEDRDGNKRTSIEIDADEITPSLKWATVQVERTSREKSSSSGGGGRQQQPDPIYGDEEPF